MQDKEFEIIREHTPECSKLIIKGYISSIYAEELQKALDEDLKSKAPLIVLNMFHVGYLCSMGISIILNTYKSARQAGSTVRIEEPSENVRKVLTITSLDGLLIQ